MSFHENKSLLVGFFLPLRFLLLLAGTQDTR
jgi:hypothetical protein